MLKMDLRQLSRFENPHHPGVFGFFLKNSISSGNNLVRTLYPKFLPRFMALLVLPLIAWEIIFRQLLFFEQTL
jgi:hypothetical protein